MYSIHIYTYVYGVRLHAPYRRKFFFCPNESTGKIEKYTFPIGIIPTPRLLLVESLYKEKKNIVPLKI